MRDIRRKTGQARRSGGARQRLAAVALHVPVAVLLSAALIFVFPGVAQARTAGAGTAAETEIPDAAELEALGAVIGKIVLVKDNVFDLSQPGENKWLYRLANRWHIVTRDSAIRQQLLFKEGDPFSARLLDESARILRQNDYFFTATVKPLHYEDGVVDVVVRTKDVWTLRPGFSVSRAGGENKSRVSLKESNLLGTGALVRLAYTDDVDRQSTSLEYSDANLGDNWVSLSLGLSRNSDGNSAHLDVIRPFFALDSRWSAGFSFLDDAKEDRLYDLGNEVAEYRHDSNYYSAFGGWSAGLEDGWVWRWTAGLVYDEERFSEADNPRLPAVFPDDRRLLYPFIGLEILEDEYVVTENRDQIGRPEDFYLGKRLTASLGYADDSLGSDRDSIVYSFGASNGFGRIASKALILSATASGRIDNGRWANAITGIDARYYNQISDKRLFFMTFDAEIGHNLDLDNPLEIGGDSGLRGYPLRYQSGDARTLFTIEERYFTDWYPFRLVRIGGAIFADVGRTWGNNPVGGDSRGWLRDVGFGLRLGPTRSGGHEVIHLDIAFPLDGDPSIDNVQFLLESKGSF